MNLYSLHIKLGGTNNIVSQVGMLYTPCLYRHCLTRHSSFNSRCSHATHKPHPSAPTRQQSHDVSHDSSDLKACSESGEQRAVQAQGRVQGAHQRAQIHGGSRRGSRDEFTGSLEDSSTNKREHGAERPQQRELPRLQQQQRSVKRRQSEAQRGEEDARPERDQALGSTHAG